MANVGQEKYTNKKSIKLKYTENLKISHQFSYIFFSFLESFLLDYSWNGFWYVSCSMYHIFLWLYTRTRWKC